jgi:hypothetical protein
MHSGCTFQKKRSLLCLKWDFHITIYELSIKGDRWKRGC